MLTPQGRSELSAEYQRYLERLKSPNPRDFSKLLTLIEQLGPSSLLAPELQKPSPPLALRIGITGPPGAGKSTLISGLIRYFRSRDLSVGVIAVDPSSPFSKGAILGDRIRFNEFFNDQKVFIRSMGSRGSLGGLCGTAYLFLRAYDAYGFDVVLIETVGVGQTELEIVNVADIVAVVLVPESGDSIQTMKAGLMEIADVFVVNKFDRPGGDLLAKELQSAVELSENSATATIRDGGEKQTKIPIMCTVATKFDGVEELGKVLVAPLSTRDFESARRSPERIQAEAEALLRAHYEKEIKAKVSRVRKPEDLKRLFEE